MAVAHPSGYLMRSPVMALSAGPSYEFRPAGPLGAARSRKPCFASRVIRDGTALVAILRRNQAGKLASGRGSGPEYAVRNAVLGLCCCCGHDPYNGSVARKDW
jgi:hypothetical protein